MSARRRQYEVENVLGKKEDDGEAAGGNIGVEVEDEDGNVCAVVSS